jgi:hypothetical protein
MLLLLAPLLGCSSPPPPAPVEAPAATPGAAPAPVAEAPPERGRPPRITRLRLSPASPRHTDAIEATAEAIDSNGEEVDLAYDWRINDAPVPEVSGPRLPPGRFRKGDRVRVDVTASTSKGSVTDKSPELTIANTVPVFRTDPRSVSTLPGTTFFADDPDGDRIQWSLENAPRGMTISPDGTVRYTGTADEPGGDYRVAVVARDGEGFARFEVPVKVSPGSEAAKAAKAREAAPR